MKLICSGLNVDIDKIEPIRNREYFNKPYGGLWTCPLRENEQYMSAWIEWCESEDFSTHDNSNYTLLDIKDDSKILILGSKEDLKNLETEYLLSNSISGLDMKYLDFEKLSNKYDAIFLTDKCQWETRFVMDTFSLYGWDVETVFIMNKECIKENSIIYFES